jgi:putative N6-adenine-specific DNA methylase
LLSGWKADCDLIDFMCGSATIPIEAAMYAINLPAGYFRKDFGFMFWRDFDQKLWENVQKEADEAVNNFDFLVYGSDISPNFIRNSRENVKKMGLNHIIKLSIESFEDVKPERVPCHIIINPPYGERMKNQIVDNFYQNLGNKLKHNFIYSVAWMITPNKEAMKSFGLRPARKIRVFNAALECTFYKFELYEGSKKSKYNKG